MKYIRAKNSNGRESVTAWVDGQSYVADSAHPNWNTIVQKLADFDASVVNDFNAAKAVNERFRRVTDRITASSSHLFIDGDVIEDVYVEHVLTALRNGTENDWRPLALFLEKVYGSNVDEHTRENLSRWLQSTNGFTIDQDGDILGYKGLRDDLTSVHAGPAVVDGQPVNGHVPNKVGSIVEMPRSEVTHDPQIGCSRGLHVGTYEYASSFGNRLVRVKFNPADVVSVPTDCSSQKVRVCRYKVIGLVGSEDEKVTAPVDNYQEPANSNWFTV